LIWLNREGEDVGELVEGAGDAGSDLRQAVKIDLRGLDAGVA
jgi:hypothetical protein